MVSGFLPRTACKVTDYLWYFMLFAFPFVHIFISPSKLMIRMNEVNHAYHRCLSYVWCNMLVRIIFFTCWINLWFAQNNSFVLFEQFMKYRCGTVVPQRGMTVPRRGTTVPRRDLQKWCWPTEEFTQNNGRIVLHELKKHCDGLLLRRLWICLSFRLSFIC